MTKSKPGKTQQMIDLEIREAKEQLANYYINAIKTIENSKEPLETVTEITKGNEDQQHREIEAHKKVAIERHDHTNLSNQSRTYGLRDQADLEQAVATLAEKELDHHHREELDTLREQTARNKYDKDDLAALSHLHSVEKEAFQNSLNPLEDTRAMTADCDRYASFDDYVEARLEQAKTLVNQNEHHFSDPEDHIKTHLQVQSEQKTFDAIIPPPLTLYDYFGHEDWRKNMRVEGNLPEYSAFEQAEYHSMDWEQHDFSLHAIDNNTRTLDDDFNLER